MSLKNNRQRKEAKKHYNVGKNNSMYGKKNNWGHHTKKAKEKIRRASKNRIITEGTKHKMSQNHADFSDKKHPRYIDGRTKAKHYCIENDCNNRTTRFSTIYGLGRCKSCATKITSIGRKRTEKTKKKISLAKGGTGIPYENSNYPEEFFKIRPKIRKRDNYTCQKCSTKFDKYSSYLDVHHIDYNKENLNPENLITLCHKCNIVANKDRDYWYAYYTYIMENRK